MTTINREWREPAGRERYCGIVRKGSIVGRVPVDDYGPNHIGGGGSIGPCAQCGGAINPRFQDRAPFCGLACVNMAAGQVRKKKVERLTKRGGE